MTLADATEPSKWIVVTSFNGPRLSIQHLSNLSGWQVGFPTWRCKIEPDLGLTFNIFLLHVQLVATHYFGDTSSHI
jgi:hypothetical protein